MGKKSKSFRGGAQRQTVPTQQEIRQLIETFKQRQYIETERFAQNITTRFPNFWLGWNAMGAAILNQHRYAEALMPFQRAAALQPHNPDPHNSLGNTFSKLFRYAEAENHYRHALEIAPDFQEAHYNLGNVLYEQKQYIEAESCYRKSLSLTPTAAAYDRLASILVQKSQYADAEYNYQKALEINPQLSAVIAKLGHLKMDKGEMKQAKILFLKTLVIDPDNIWVRYNLTRLEKVQSEDPNFLALIKIEKKIREGKLPPPNNMAALHFALGKAYADVGEHDKSFLQFISGCKRHRTTLKYDSTQKTRYFSRIIETFSSTNLSRLSGTGNSSSIPIFVVGMPRSGTTLTEQIIASHPNTHGAGELNHLMSIVENSSPYPDNISGLSLAQLTNWANDYLNALQQYAPEAQRITDKMPGHFIAIGLIHVMFPNAKIIHVSRHPLDNCISCFTQLFQNGQPYSYDLVELGYYYADYVRLMEHWRKVLPNNAFLDVRYEDIVADKEKQARRLIKYCGLEWNDACLDFHKNKRSVHTASVAQVRQPIYTSSVARWKPYEKFLDPLIEALGDSIQKFESTH